MPQPWELADLPLHRLLAEARAVRAAGCRRSIRLAVLGEGATQHYTMALSAVLKLRGFWPEVYEAEFDTIRQEVTSPDSGLNRHHPRFVVLFHVVQALQDRLGREAKLEGLAEALSEEIGATWDRILTLNEVTILQHNLCVPTDRTFGNLSSSSPRCLAHAVKEVNRRLDVEARLRRGVRIIDTEFQAAYFGKRAWLDERMWCQARQPLSPSFLPPLAKAVSDAILIELGIGTKCVVLDLDNTLWGGVLGDDGIEGIDLGRTEVGLAYRRFQVELAALRSRGVLLAVCSRNHPDLARRAVSEHPDMVLRLDDFAAFVADFQDKRESLLAIRDELNIDLDAMLFLDDSSFEREGLRRAFPEMQVPELPEDAGEVLSALSRWNLFEAAENTPEDARRADYYREDARRQELRREFEDLEAYLASLAMEAEVRPFDEFSLPRVLQLVQRSNQFNLTTRRYGAAELEALRNEPRCLTFTVRLRDRLGDNGIVAAVIGLVSNRDLVVDTWIMSCRVLGRRLEDLTAALLMAEARKRGCKRVVGQYRASGKNRLVADLYPRLGFIPVADEEGIQSYAADVEAWTEGRPPIRVIQAEAREGSARDERNVR